MPKQKEIDGGEVAGAGGGGSIIPASAGNMPLAYDAEKIALLKRTIARGASDDELAMAIEQCKRTQLDPFSRQIYFIKRWSQADGCELMTVQISIDGARLVAQRSGEYEGQTQPEWCGKDGVWRNVWLNADAPMAARVGIWRKNFREPVYAVALFTEYAARKKDGTLTQFWKTKPALMLAKCAESMALRKAFPQELSGLYTREEMEQADGDSPKEFVPRAPIAVPTPRKQIAATGQAPPVEPDPEESIPDFDTLDGGQIPEPEPQADTGIQRVQGKIESLSKTENKRKPGTFKYHLILAGVKYSTFDAAIQETVAKAGKDAEWEIHFEVNPKYKSNDVVQIVRTA